MVLFNYATKELTAKVVYYGPGLCGKTTNLQYVYDTLPNHARGKMLSLATKTDRTLFFDFLPIDLGKIRGMKTKIQLYTVPGQVFYDTTRKLVLKGADGVVFVADSQQAMVEANTDSLQNLATNLKEQNIELKDMPHVIQYNKRDMKNVLTVAELEEKLNIFNVPCFEAVAVTGDGVFETLKGISKVVLKNLSRKYGLEEEINDTDPDLAGRRSSVSMPKVPDLPPTPRQRAEMESASRASAALEEQNAAASRAKAAAKVSFDDDQDQFGSPTLPEEALPSKPSSSKSAPKSEKSLPRQASAGLDEIEFIEDDNEGFGNSAPAAPKRVNKPLAPIPSLDDSEVIELDDMEPLEIEEMDDMAAIAKLAGTSPANKAQEPLSVAVSPIEVPVTINLPGSLAGKPLRLQIDILFSE